MFLLKSFPILMRTSSRMLSGLCPKNIYSDQIIKVSSTEKTMSHSPNYHGGQQHEGSKYRMPFLFMFTLPLFQKVIVKDEEDTPLIAKIREGLESIQKEEMMLAERQLHAALKMARDDKNATAVNYVLSLMANLSFIVEDYAQAEMIYVDLLQKFITSGMDFDDSTVMTISLKLAIIFALTEQHEKALAGYDFCIEKLQPKMDDGCTDVDVMVLYGMVQEAYGNYLMRGDMYDEAEERLLIAHNMCLTVKGPNDPQTAVLLNALAKVAVCKKDYDKAIDYFEKAIAISTSSNHDTEVAFVINLAMTKLLQGLPCASATYCTKAIQLAEKHNSDELKAQANFCLVSVKEYELSKS